MGRRPRCAWKRRFVRVVRVKRWPFFVSEHPQRWIVFYHASPAAIVDCVGDFYLHLKLLWKREHSCFRSLLFHWASSWTFRSNTKTWLSVLSDAGLVTKGILGPSRHKIRLQKLWSFLVLNIPNTYVWPLWWKLRKGAALLVFEWKCGSW